MLELSTAHMKTLVLTTNSGKVCRQKEKGSHLRWVAQHLSRSCLWPSSIFGLQENISRPDTENRISQNCQGLSYTEQLEKTFWSVSSTLEAWKKEALPPPLAGMVPQDSVTSPIANLTEGITLSRGKGFAHYGRSIAVSWNVVPSPLRLPYNFHRACD